MRPLVSHLILTLDGVACFDAVADTIIELRADNTGGGAGPRAADSTAWGDFFGRVAEEDAMLMGRTTYEEWAGYWPTIEGQPFADHVNAVPKYVASSTLTEAPWGERDPATVLDGDVAARVRELKAADGGPIGVHGSPTLVEWLLQADLLDELRLEVYPVVAGSGRRLFTADGPSRRLTLMGSTITANGVAILSYGRA